MGTDSPKLLTNMGLVLLLGITVLVVLIAWVYPFVAGVANFTQMSSIGENCWNNSECWSGFCLRSHYIMPGGYCSDTCKTDRDCQEHYLCRTVQASDAICYKEPRAGHGDRCGRAEECLSGVCITVSRGRDDPGFNMGVCGTDCDENRACAEGSSCARTSDSDRALCIPWNAIIAKHKRYVNAKLELKMENANREYYDFETYLAKKGGKLQKVLGRQTLLSTFFSISYLIAYDGRTFPAEFVPSERASDQ